MKKINQIFIIVITLFCFTTVNAQGGQEASLYFSEVIEPFESLKEDTWSYLKAVTKRKGAKKVEGKRIELLKNLKSASKKVKAKKGYGSSTEFRDAIVKYFDLTYIVLNEDFGKILDMEEISEQSYDAMEAYLLAKEKANEKLHEVSATLSTAQSKFAEENDFKLLEGSKDKTSKKIEQANKVLKYYNTLYLVFFKSHKQEAYLLDALNRNDVNGLEQSSSSLKTTANEGLAAARSQSNYEDDPSLKLATIEILKFYKKEGEKDFPSIVDYYIKKDNFEKVKTAVEAKSQKKRTQQDIDQYNQSMKEFNESVVVFNKVINDTNSERSSMLKLWNKKVDKFFDKHAK